jgi:cystathionine beta-synthase
MKARPSELISAHKGEKIGHVVEGMKKHGISQMPVIDSTGRALGMIHEYDLLNALVGGRQAGEPIDPIVAPLQGIVSPGTGIPTLKDVFAQDNVAVVKDGEKIIAIVTKIDFIEFLAARVG